MKNIPLKRWILSKNESVAAFADSIGTSRQMMSHIINGRSKMPDMMLEKIMEKYHDFDKALIEPDEPFSEQDYISSAADQPATYFSTDQLREMGRLASKAFDQLTATMQKVDDLNALLEEKQRRIEDLEDQVHFLRDQLRSNNA